MKKFALFDENGILLGYSQFPVKDYRYSVTNRDGSISTYSVRCEPDFDYAPENVGKKHTNGKFENS